MTLHSALRILETSLLLAGCLFLGRWIGTEIAAGVFQRRESVSFERARAQAGLVRELAPEHLEHALGPARRNPGVLGRLEIPRLGISAMIAEGTGEDALDRAIGHFASSAPPGGDGNCALAGHRDTFLKGLGRVRERDVARLVTLTGTYDYEVEWAAVVDPSRVDLLDPTRDPSLTLVTCYPFRSIGPSKQRFVVRARLIERGRDEAARRPPALLTVS